jgi:hypothetical protein
MLQVLLDLSSIPIELNISLLDTFDNQDPSFGVRETFRNPDIHKFESMRK